MPAPGCSAKHSHETGDQGEDGQDVEQAHRLDQRLADLLRVAQRGDAADDGAEDDRRDHHLHELDEAVAQRLERRAEIGPVVSNGDAEGQANRGPGCRDASTAWRGAWNASWGGPCGAPVSCRLCRGRRDVCRDSAQRGQHAVDHHAGLAEVVGRVAQPRQRRPVEMRADLAGAPPAGRAADAAASPLRGRCRRPGRARIRGRCSGPRPIITASLITRPWVRSMLRRIACGIDLETLEHEARLLQRAGHQAEGLGQHDPLDLPRARCERSWSATIASISAAACWRTTEIAAWM